MIAMNEQRDRHPERIEGAERGGQRGRAGRRGHGDGQHVVGEQGGAGHLGDGRAEVVLGDEVRATGGGVLLDRLPVGQDQEAEHHAHRHGDREDEGERDQPGRRDEHVEDLLGAVGDRRQVVGGEHGQGGRLAQPLVLELVTVERLAQQLALQAVRQRVRRQGDARLRRLGPGRGPQRPWLDGRAVARRVALARKGRYGHASLSSGWGNPAHRPYGRHPSGTR